jgi:glycosyltransferase involved in cell wall biosynthesis
MPTPKNLLVITYWPFGDALVQTYTLPYLRIILKELPNGSVIHLVTLEHPGIPLKSAIEAGIRHHPCRYAPFGLKGILKISVLILKFIRLILMNNIQMVHAWCTPAGMLGYLAAKATGRPLVVDSYEPHAEAMVENGTWSRNGLAFKILFHFEKLQTRKAVAVIAAAPGMEEYAREKFGIIPKRMFIRPACVDLERFSLQNRKRPELLRKYGLEGKLICVYAGKFGGIYQDREVFAFFRACQDRWGDRFHALLLTPSGMPELRPFMESEGVDLRACTLLRVPHAEVPDLLGLGDFAITPVKPVPSKRFCSPIKNGEYWALGLPVVITPNISEDSWIILANGAGAVLSGPGKAANDRAVSELDILLRSNTMEELYTRIRPLAERYRNYSTAERVYSELYGPT